MIGSILDYTQKKTNLDKMKIKELLQSYQNYDSDFSIDKNWIFTRYFDVP